MARLTLEKVGGSDDRPASDRGGADSMRVNSARCGIIAAGTATRSFGAEVRGPAARMGDELLDIGAST